MIKTTVVVLVENLADIFQAQFLAPRAVFPSPLRWIYYLAKFIYRRKNEKKQGRNESNIQKTRYFQLLKHLILAKQQYEYENTEEDNLTDLRTDICQDMNLIEGSKKEEARIEEERTKEQLLEFNLTLQKEKQELVKRNDELEKQLAKMKYFKP